MTQQISTIVDRDALGLLLIVYMTQQISTIVDYSDLHRFHAQSI